MKIRFTLLAAASLAAGLLGACSSKSPDPTPTPATPTLYDRVGKTDGVTKLVDGLIANIVAETAAPNSVLLRVHQPLLNAVNGVNGAAPTDPTRVQRLRANFINQLGEATGGPLKYTGKSMLVAHTGMNITTTEYDAWFAQWEKTLSANSVTGQDRTDLNAILNKMQGDVVGH